MALYAFDGTGNEDQEDATRDSNVCDFFTAYEDPLKNDDPSKERGSLYIKGIGQLARTRIGRRAGVGASGFGGHRRVRKAMDRLENNIEAGDRTIDIVGFSRGAALAISFANEIAKKMPRVSIRFIGVWDIVGQFGAPGEHINAGHDLDFPPNVAHCFHAMALDESRLFFPLTRLGKGRNTSSKLQEVWFRGVHSDVGGGNGNRGLNWVALNWMYEAARRCGLPLNAAAVAQNLADKAMAQQISAHKLDAGTNPASILEQRSAALDRATHAGNHRTAAQQPDLPVRPHRRCGAHQRARVVLPYDAHERGHPMRAVQVKLWLFIVLVVLTSWVPSSARGVAETGQGPALTSIGPMTFGPDGTLFAADNQAAAVFGLDLAAQASGAVPGTKGLDGIDQKIAAMLGTGAREIAITDLVVHPKSRNTFVSVMRGQGAGAAPALLRVDGAGTIDMVSLQSMKFSKLELPNAPTANPNDRRNARGSSITDMAFSDGRLWIAGLSSEEFSSKLRSVPYPFSSIDAGTSVEIFHGNHGALETRSPVYTFLPYTLNNQPHLIAGYLCTPLVKFPIATLKPGEKVRGTTIAELGAGNRPLDMILYKKNGRDFLLMSNNSRGVMKIATDGFASASAITSPVAAETAGVPYETIASMKGVEQLDLLDAQNSIVIARAAAGLNLQIVPLP